jgi:1,4-alpha-glucan branching enzyme
MYGHPGKKLLFMGDEFGQEREWDHDRSLDWHLLADEFHQGVLRLVRDLNSVICKTTALHELDNEHSGFQWIDAADRSSSIVSFERRGKTPGDHVVVIVNFTPIVRTDYRIGMPSEGPYREIFNSDDRRYGGSGVGNAGTLVPQALSWHGRAHSMPLTLPPLSAIYLAPASG